MTILLRLRKEVKRTNNALEKNLLLEDTTKVGIIQGHGQHFIAKGTNKTKHVCTTTAIQVNLQCNSVEVRPKELYASRDVKYFSATD